MRKILIALGIVAGSAFAVASGPVHALPACEDGAVIVVRVNRAFPCNPDGDNVVHIRYPKVYGADDVREDCAALGGRYLEGPANRWCRHIDV